MIDARDVDRIRCILDSIEGVRGFALTLTFETKIEVILGGEVAPRASADAIEEIAAQHCRTVAGERPLRFN